MIIGKRKKISVNDQKKLYKLFSFLHIYRCTSLYPQISLFIVWFETKLFNFYLRCDILPAENINISKLFQQYLCKSIHLPPSKQPLTTYDILYKNIYLCAPNLSALNKILNNSDFRLWDMWCQPFELKWKLVTNFSQSRFISSILISSVLSSE